MKHFNTRRRFWLTTITLGMVALTFSTTSVSLANDWMFAKSDFSHNPATGQRLTQYASVAPIEGLPDPRDTTSRYSISRTQLRGTNGSNDTVFEVRSFGDARGRDDARWERGFEAWKDAASIAGPFWAGAYWPGGTPAPGLDYQNQGFGTGFGFGAVPYGAGQFGAGQFGAGQFGAGRAGFGGVGAVPYGFGAFGGGAVGPYTGFGPNGFFGGPNVPFGTSPFGYGFAPRSAFGGYPPYGGQRPYHPGHGGGGHPGGGQHGGQQGGNGGQGPNGGQGGNAGQGAAG